MPSQRLLSRESASSTVRVVAATLGALLWASAGWPQDQGPVELKLSGSPAPRPARPPDPTFDNPNPDPRDFEGLWSPGRLIQSLSPIPAGAVAPPPAPPPEGPAATPAPGSAPAPDPARGSGPLTGPIIGMAAVNADVGSTLQCTPTWRLVGAGGGMSNYWIMGNKEIVLYAEEDQDVARKIYLNAKHPAHLQPQPNGYSIGHWEGNVLVVDTIGFSNADGTLAKRHVTERIERHGSTLVDDAVVQNDGQTIYLRMPSAWRPDYTVSENVCEEGFRRYELRDGQVINLNTLPKD